MAYGEPIEDIQDAYDDAAPVVKQEVDDYDNADDYDNVKDKAATVVETETDTYDNGRSYETIAAETPDVEQSNADYKGFVDVVEPTIEENVVTIPEQTGVIYVDGDTYDPEPEEGEPVIDVLEGDIELDDTDLTELNVLAVADEGYKFYEDATISWSFEYAEPEQPEA